MAGMFEKGEEKIRPGTYYRYENSGSRDVAGAVNGIGAALMKSDWGPLGKAVEVEDADDLPVLYGEKENVAGLMFRGGCVTVQAVRVGSGGTEGKLTLLDSAEKDAVTLMTRYPSGRKFAVTVRENLTGDAREFLVYEGTKEIEKIAFPSAGLDAFVLAVNGGVIFSAKKLEGAGETLKEVSQQEITPGASPEVTVDDYSAAMDVVEPLRWNVLCLDSSDTAVHALAAAFVERTEADGMFPMLCIAETKDVPLTTRMEHAAAMNDEKIVYVLNPALDSAGEVVDGWKLAALVGGMVAAVSSAASLTHQVIKAFSGLAERLSNRQIIKALGMGCLCLTENTKKQVWVESAINTLITVAENQDNGWKKIRRTKTRFELMDRVTATTDPLIGKVDNDPDGRATVKAAAQNVVNTMDKEKKLLPGGKVYEDTANPAKGDSMWFIVDADDIDSGEKIYIAFRFRFAPEA